MITARYSRSIQQPRRALGAATTDQKWTIPIILGGSLGLGLLGILYLEWSQGWRPGGRSRRRWR